MSSNPINASMRKRRIYIYIYIYMYEVYTELLAIHLQYAMQ